jgi:hypothetical protein
MPAENEAKRFLVIFSIAKATPARLGEIMPRLKPALDQLSADPVELAFRSTSGESFGYVLRTRRAARQISMELESPGGNAYSSELRAKHMPFLTGSDGILVIELGPDFHTTSGFTRVGTWLQRH